MVRRFGTRRVHAAAFALVLAVLTASAASIQPAIGASSSSTVVGATVASATSIDAAACLPRVAGSTNFGSMLPGTAAATTIDCDVKFGSSNDTSQLRIAQADSFGVGMWQSTRGALDQAFDGPLGGGNGSFIEPIGTAADDATEIVVQPDGRYVVGGGCEVAGQTNFCLARYLPDGARDVTFDGPSGTGDGEFTDTVVAGYNSLNALALDASGNIVVGGRCSGPRFCLARYLPNGARDLTFDGPSGSGDGRFTDPIGANDGIADIAIQPDGKIVAVGFCLGTTYSFCAARYMPDGRRDVTFDGPSGTANGAFILRIGPEEDYVDTVRIQPDGKLLVAGTCYPLSWVADFCAVRLNADGSLDASFDGASGFGNGALMLPLSIPNADNSAGMELVPGGGFVIAGDCYNGTNQDVCVARFDSNGVLEPTFDGPAGSGNGWFLDPISTTDDYITSMVVEPSGSIVVTGYCRNGATWDTCLARYLEDGSRDATFDGPSGTGDGHMLHSVGSGADFAYDLALGPDGVMVVSGGCSNGVNNDFCLIALDEAGVIADYVTGGGSDRDWASGPATSFFGACLRAVSGGATASWTATNPCATTDGPAWHAVPTTSERVAFASALDPDPVDATAHIRFAMRAASDQAPGTYVAPIRFEVLAPS